MRTRKRSKDQLRAIHASYANGYKRKGYRKRKKVIVKPLKKIRKTSVSKSTITKKAKTIKPPIIKARIPNDKSLLSSLHEFEEYRNLPYNEREAKIKANKEHYRATKEKLIQEINANINTNDEKVDKAIYEVIHSDDYDLEKDKNDVILYHGTSYENAQIILEEGLIGGDNTAGGTHGKWDIPTLFLTPNQYTAEKYGNTLLEVRIPLRDYWKNYYKKVDITNDGLGDRVYIWTAEDIAGKDWNDDTVIIPNEYIQEKNRSDYFPDD